MKPFEEYLTGKLTLEGFTSMLRLKPWGYIDDINNAIYSRWGDGEFSAIFQMDGKNCDGHKYYPSLGYALETALKKQMVYGFQYYYGLVPIAVKVFGDKIQEYLNTEIPFKEHRPNWVSGNLLMQANREGNLGEFFSVLRDRYRILYVGPDRLQVLQSDSFINITSWISVSHDDAWKSYEETLRDIVYFLLKDDCNMIGFSAGMTSKVWISDLKQMFGKMLDIPIIDFGSMWDGYYGFNSRKYHHDFDWGEIRRMNLG